MDHKETKQVLLTIAKILPNVPAIEVKKNGDRITRNRNGSTILANHNELIIAMYNAGGMDYVKEYVGITYLLHDSFYANKLYSNLIAH